MSNRPEDKSKGKGESVFDKAIHAFSPIDKSLQDIRAPQAASRIPKPLGKQNQRSKDRESPQSKDGERTINAFNHIDHLLPELEGKQPASNTNNGGGKGQAQATGGTSGQRLTPPRNSVGLGERNTPTSIPKASSSRTPKPAPAPAPTSATARRAAYERQKVQAVREKASKTPRQGNPSNLKKPGNNTARQGNLSNSNSKPRNNNARQGNRGNNSKPLSPAPNDPNHLTDDGNNSDNGKIGRPGRESLPCPADSGLKLPFDLVAETYAASIRDRGCKNYLDYPARVHHLKYPTPTASSVDWEYAHLHQKVSLERVHMRWNRSMTTDDRRNMDKYFLRFNSSSNTENSKQIMGFRPYRDTLVIDCAYLQGYDDRMVELLGPKLDDSNTDPGPLVPFLAAADREKIKILAVEARAFVPEAKINCVATVLARAFPHLERIFTTATAVIDRPAPASWDLETEFAWWMPFDEAVLLEKREGKTTVADFGKRYDLIPVAEARSSLALRVEDAFNEARKEILAKSEETKAQKSLDEEPATGGDLDVLVFEADGSDHEPEESEDQPQAFKAEPYIMLYFRDAYDRAVSHGMSEPSELVSLAHVDLGLK